MRPFAPSLDLYRRVRAGFIVQDTTLNEWCKANAIKAPNARTCLVGSWDGPTARQLRARICEAAGLTHGRGNA
ncbi:MAG: hypothetical protein U0973_11580 [Xanthomonadaceae bacterium]|nr:hypothetical protein [Xanthomonadaceae bacterium]